MRTLVAVGALVLTLAPGMHTAGAQSVSDAGKLLRIDPSSRVIAFEDGRMYRAVAGTTFRVDDRPETFTSLRPGMHLVIDAGEPVVYRRGKYIALPALPSDGVLASPR